MSYKRIIYLSLLLICFSFMSTKKRSNATKILLDLGHGQRFWNDPNKMSENDNQFGRVKYMTDELIKTVSKVNGQIAYNYDIITSEDLDNTDILFIHIPSTQYSKKEVNNIQQFVKKGGGLFLVMDVDYWSSLEQTNVNELLEGFDIKYEGKIPDSIPGGYTTKSIINKEPLKISYHGGRIVKGGIPFCYGNETKDFSFGVYKEIEKGKIVVMGDGMPSLYMTSWNGVNDYQCQEFMQSVFQWLLKRD